MKKFLILLFGLISYALFLAAFLYAIGFVGDRFVPYTVNSGGSTSENAWIINILLLSVWALPHSIMARPAFKKWWTTIFSPAVERSIYVFQSSALLFLIYYNWQPMTTKVWNIEGALYIQIIEVIFWSGWLIVLISTFLINHFHLFGLLQIFENFKNKTLSSPKFKKNLFYKLVRHPIMSGFIVAFWATPVMTQGQFLFAAVSTVYIFIAVKFLEERDLVNLHGEAYTNYQKETPMIIPFTKFKKK